MPVLDLVIRGRFTLLGNILFRRTVVIQVVIRDRVLRDDLYNRALRMRPSVNILEPAVSAIEEKA